ncbi:MAG: carboxylesterase family protein [Deltaproteobacteria bacterium]|nr:carboxylesterase family protein [Deltaproteobacteria bacterium]
MGRQLAILVAALLVLAACGSDSDPGGTGGSGAGGGGGDPWLVETESGPVQGTAIGTARAFLGIPYAAPPIDALRFKSPQPVEPWTEPLDGSEVGPACAQVSLLNGEVVSNTVEDCLTLNVWTPDASSSDPRPVLVWIHGGGFEGGSGHGDGATTGEHLAPAADAVVVTVNYRLGPFGFLAHPALTSEDPARSTSGNYGLEDQRFALQWVQANVAAFGGDPNNVTVFGESAGGISLCLHLVSPESAGLLHQAVIQSGPCDIRVTTLNAAEQQGDELASAVDCDTATDVPACLRDKSATEILEALPGKAGLMFGEGADWGPNVDGVVLLDTAGNLLEAGTYQDVPVVLGSTRDEGTLFVALAGLTDITETEYEDRVMAFAAEHGGDGTAALARYPASAYDSPAAALSALLGHSVFSCPTRRAARALAGHGTPTYLYQFTHAIPFGVAGDLGAFHSSELGFIFGASQFGSLTPEEQPLYETMQGYWSQLAATGDPNGGTAPSWTAYDEAADNHLELDLTITERAGLLSDECDFWDEQ